MRGRRGIVSILSLILLIVLSSVAVAMVGFCGSSIVKAGNHMRIQGSVLAAESGLSFYIYLIRKLIMSPSAEGQDLLDELHAKLSTRPELVARFGPGAVSYDGTRILIPAVEFDENRSFEAQIELISEDSLQLKITGRHENVSRKVSMNFALCDAKVLCPGKGIISRGRIHLTGNDRILGLNSADEGTIYSESDSNPVLSMTGNARVEGDFYATHPDGQASLTGNISIGGATGSAVGDHLHFSAASLEIPEVDPSVFVPYATNIVNAGMPTSGNRTFTNIRIAANTNPNFSGNITIKGVVYIEKPNKVTFSGNLSFTGVIVTDPGHDNPGDCNQISFTGNTSSAGVEALPDTHEFHDLRELKGAFMLAPGFTTKFTGNFGTVNGVMAAERFTFTGNAGGTVRGSIISYGTDVFRMTGNSHLTFDHQTYTDPIPGLTSLPKFSFIPDTYLEPMQ